MLDLVRARVPWVRVERLTVTHAADDDNVYFLGDRDDHNLVQIDTWPDGRPPFLIEGHERTSACDVHEAAEAAVHLLRHARHHGV